MNDRVTLFCSWLVAWGEPVAPGIYSHNLTETVRSIGSFKRPAPLLVLVAVCRRRLGCPEDKNLGMTNTVEVRTNLKGIFGMP